MRRGLASFARDVRDDADLAGELLEVYRIALDVLTNKIVEGAVVRALRVLAVDQTHGCGYEVEVAAGSEGSVAHDVCRPEHAARTACVCVVRELGARCWRLRVMASQRALLSLPDTSSASACDVASQESMLSLPQTRLFAARGSKLRQHGSLVHPEETLDAVSHADATLSTL